MGTKPLPLEIREEIIRLDESINHLESLTRDHKFMATGEYKLGDINYDILEFERQKKSLLKPYINESEEL